MKNQIPSGVPPTIAEPITSGKEWLRESSEAKQIVNRPTIQTLGLAMKLFKVEPSAGQLAYGKRMNPIREVASHQTVSTPLVHVQPRTTSDGNAQALSVNIEKALQKTLPPRKLVNLVEDNAIANSRRNIQPNILRNAIWSGPEFQGNPSSDILNYCEFTVYGTDFEGNEIRKDLCTGAHDTVIVCTKAPAKDKSVFATLCTKASAETLPEGQYSVDYSFRVTYAVYDEKGNELSSGFVTRTSSTGILSATEFQNEMAGNRLNKKFELYCDETDGKSEYGFAWKDAGPM
mgnify:CR=1 FL=1